MMRDGNRTQDEVSIQCCSNETTITSAQHIS